MLWDVTTKKGIVVLGFAIIHEDERTIAAWLVSRDGNAAANTNAVVLHTDGRDPDLGETLGNLLHERAVLGAISILDEGSARARGSVSLDAVKAWDEDRQAVQTEINAFVHRTNKNWKIPFHDTALVPFPTVEHGVSKDASLVVANYLRNVWTKWLTTEAERVRRSLEGKNRVPDELSSTDYCAVPLSGLDTYRWSGPAQESTR